MQTKIYVSTLLFLSMALAAVFLGSCQKNGELMEAPEVINVSITGFSINAAAAFTVEVNGGVVNDSLYNGEVTTKLVIRAGEMQHILIKDHFTGATLLDTAVAMPGKTALLTILQLEQGMAPELVSNVEGNIPDHHRLQGFIYSSDVLPDSIGLQIYGCHFDPNTFELLKIDTLATYEKIKKGELSVFLPVKDNMDPSSVVYFYQPLDATTMLPLANQAAPFDPAIFSGYQFPFEPGPTGKEKHYIDRIMTSGSPALFDLYLERMISY